MSTLSKQRQKYIQSLHNKKYRKQFGQFIVEGRKSIEELVASNFDVEIIYLAHDVHLDCAGIAMEYTNETNLGRISTLKSNNYGLAVVNTKEFKLPSEVQDWAIMLDDVRDPGNLGTIIRLADWYGINHIFCSINCVEFENPKVISSTMGSFTRVQVHYGDLISQIKQYGLPVFAAAMDGKSAHSSNFSEKGFLLMGSESHGISEELKEFAKNIIAIPAFGAAESLNVAVATGILLDNIRRSTADQTIG